MYCTELVEFPSHILSVDHIRYMLALFACAVVDNVDLCNCSCCLLQSIPSDMEFDPNSNPPCYKTKEEVIHCSVLPVCDMMV